MGDMGSESEGNVGGAAAGAAAGAAVNATNADGVSAQDLRVAIHGVHSIGPTKAVRSPDASNSRKRGREGGGGSAKRKKEH